MKIFFPSSELFFRAFPEADLYIYDLLNLGQNAFTLILAISLSVLNYRIFNNILMNETVQKFNGDVKAISFTDESKSLLDLNATQFEQRPDIIINNEFTGQFFLSRTSEPPENLENLRSPECLTFLYIDAYQNTPVRVVECQNHE